MTDIRPRRSALLVPATATALAAARSEPADALILDLADSLPPADKEAGAAHLATRLREGGFAAAELVVRVNGLDTPWGEADLAAGGPGRTRRGAGAAGRGAGGSGRDRQPPAPPPRAERVRLWACLDTPLGILAAEAVASAVRDVDARLACLVVDAGALAREGRLPPGAPEAGPLLNWLATVLAAARAHDLDVLLDPADRLDIGRAAGLGFDGAVVTAPAGARRAESAFAPDPEALAAARALVAAFDAPQARGTGGHRPSRPHGAAARGGRGAPARRPRRGGGGPRVARRMSGLDVASASSIRACPVGAFRDGARRLPPGSTSMPASTPPRPWSRKAPPPRPDPGRFRPGDPRSRLVRHDPPALRPRPSRGLVLGNTVGVIDADYEGPLMISAWNRNPPGAAPVTVRPGERIAQLVFTRVVRPSLHVVEAFPAAEAGAAGPAASAPPAAAEAVLGRGDPSRPAGPAFGLGSALAPPRLGLALAAMVDIALHARPQPVSAKALAARHALPPRHLEAVLQALVHHGLLKGLRGPHGGYELARERRRISAGDIARAVSRSGAAAESALARPRRGRPRRRPPGGGGGRGVPCGARFGDRGGSLRPGRGREGRRAAGGADFTI